MIRRNHGIDEKFIRSRITELREKKGVSENKMSEQLGHSRTYLQNIRSERTMPSIKEFLSICDYLDVTPKQFFDVKDKTPALINRNIRRVRALDEKAQKAVSSMLDIIEQSQVKPKVKKKDKELITIK